ALLAGFAEWRAAPAIVGPPAGGGSIGSPQPAESPIPTESQIPNPKSLSLPAHLERVLMRLTSARANGALGEAFDGIIDRVSSELDAARSQAHGLRGEARRTLIDRLSVLDADLLEQARRQLDDSDRAARAALAREADEDLRVFRSGMTATAFAHAHEAAVDRLVRERFNLPTIVFG